MCSLSKVQSRLTQKSSRWRTAKNSCSCSLVSLSLPSLSRNVQRKECRQNPIVKTLRGVVRFRCHRRRQKPDVRVRLTWLDLFRVLVVYMSNILYRSEPVCVQTQDTLPRFRSLRSLGRRRQSDGRREFQPPEPRPTVRDGGVRLQLHTAYVDFADQLYPRGCMPSHVQAKFQSRCTRV